MEIELKQRSTAGKHAQLIRNAARWLDEHADDLTADLDRMHALGDELRLDVRVSLNSLSTVSVDREYVVI